MSKKRYVLSLLFLILMICAAFSLVQAVCATKYNVVDEGFGSVKDSNVTKLHWKVYSSGKQLVIYNRYVKGNSTVLTKKISIKKLYNKLSINSKNSRKGVTNEKNYLITSKLKPESYYFKIYQSKMFKNIVTKKSFDKGDEFYSHAPVASIKWNAYIYHGKKVLVLEKYRIFADECYKKTLIERYGKNKLKISLKIKDENHHIIPFDVYSRKFSNNKSVSYVKTNLNPKDYYFKFIRPKILKNVMREHSIESFYGLLKDSKRELYWYASIHVNDELISYKLTVSRRFSYHNGTYDKTIIEIFSKNKLKITYKVNKTTEVTYLNTKLLPRDYYDKVYRPEMIEMFDKSTIKHLPNDY